jgi:WD40 repeat protein
VHSLVKEQAVSLAFNPDGSLLAVGTARNLILINTASGEEVARIPHSDMVNGVSFSVDGNILVTASSKVLQFWDVTKLPQIKTDDLITAACSRLIANLDKAQWQALFGNDNYQPLCKDLPIPQ